jgi:hypothetical protein
MTTVPPQSWEMIEAVYRNGGPHVEAMAELARRVRLSGIGRSLYGIVSHHRLHCSQHEVAAMLDPRLTIMPTEDHLYCMTYEFSAGFRGQPLGSKDVRERDWTATYGATDLIPAFSRFLSRVGWFPEGHPAHRVLLGEQT